MNDMNFWNQIYDMKNNGKPFMLYGKNEDSWFLKLMNCLDVKISGIIDDDPRMRGGVFGGIKVLSLSELVESDKLNDFNYIIAIDYYITIEKRLLGAGVAESSIIWINRGKIGIEENNNVSYMIENYNEFQKNLLLFGDEKSKIQYWQMCMFRIDYNEERLKNIEINAYNQYFDPLITLSNNEIYVDVGAYDGKTILNFLERVKGEYDKIIAIEASPKNSAIMKERLKDYKDIDYLQYAITDKDGGKIAFDEGFGASCKVAENGNIFVSANSIDNLINEKVTYIKADIEGAETMMIEGMINTIKKYRPKLAICIYHSSEDMLNIPRRLNEICDNYKFYFRQHGEGICESVCYAIPM